MSRTGHRAISVVILLLVSVAVVLAAPSAPSLISPGSSSSPGQTITDLTPRMR
jgi:hypothetical protein